MSSVPENRENFFESSVNQTSTHILISAQEEDIFPKKLGKCTTHHVQHVLFHDPFKT